MRGRLPALLLAALTLAACGKYGPPVRSAPTGSGCVAEEAEAVAPEQACPDERDADEEAPR